MGETTRVLLVGSTAIIVTEFIVGFDVDRSSRYEDAAIYFKEALKDFKDISITHIPNHLIDSQFPRSKEELAQYHVLLLSDCGRNTLEMYPEVNIIPMGPDRIGMIVDYVASGGSLVMAGGWKSFQGFRSSANYSGSRIEDLLPVKMLLGDDRIEITEGIKPSIIQGSHPIFKGIPADWPSFSGYNKLLPKTSASVLASIGINDPFIVSHNIEKGVTIAFSSGLAPHWGIDFVRWRYYGIFWYQVINWLGGRFA